MDQTTETANEDKDKNAPATKPETSTEKGGAKKRSKASGEDDWSPKKGRSCLFRFMGSGGVVHALEAKVTHVHRNGTVDLELDASAMPGPRTDTYKADEVKRWNPKGPVNCPSLPAYDQLDKREV